MCELVYKLYKQRAAQDLYKYTPYSRFRASFLAWEAHKQAGMLAELQDPTPWEARRFSIWSRAHHVKWHSGLVDNLRHRQERDSGNCRLGVNEDTCLPAFQFWKEVARQYEAISSPEGLNITQLRCRPACAEGQPDCSDSFW